MNLTAFVGNRLSFKRESRGTSSGVVIAVAGIAVAYVIMILALSIVSGFKHEIINKLAGFNSQISVLPGRNTNESGESGVIRLSDSLRSIIDHTLPGVNIDMAINQPAVFKTDSTFQGVVLRGISAGSNNQFITDNIVEGCYDDSLMHTPDNIAISSTTASALGVKVGEKIITHFFDGNNLRSRNLKVAAIYDSHFSDFDRNIAFAPIGMLQNLYGLDSLSATAIELRGLDYDRIPAASSELYETLLQNALYSRASSGTIPEIYRVENMLQQCAMYINWLNLLDTNVVVIIVLMILFSGFTLISSLFIIILERVNMIGLFKALGATNRQIRSIFIYMTQRLVLRGLIIGNIIGLGIIFAQSQWHILPLDPEAYYLNYVPMEFSLLQTLLLNAGVILLSAAILILPSCLISSLSPVKTLKYE